jgi:hypothetical protein
VCSIAAVAIIVGLVATCGDGDDAGGRDAETDGGGDGAVSNGGNGASNGDSEETPTPPPAPTPATVEFIEAPAGFTAPALLGEDSQCTTGGDASAVLTWQPSPFAEEQEVNVLLGGDNFIPGNYLSSGSLAGNVTQFTLASGLRPGALYFWRINTRVESGWIAGVSSEFETARCPPTDQAQ